MLGFLNILVYIYKYIYLCSVYIVLKVSLFSFPLTLSVSDLGYNICSNTVHYLTLILYTNIVFPKLWKQFNKAFNVGNDVLKNLFNSSINVFCHSLFISYFIDIKSMMELQMFSFFKPYSNPCFAWALSLDQFNLT